MKQTAIVNLYNFIRMSNEEPSVFIQADLTQLPHRFVL